MGLTRLGTSKGPLSSSCLNVGAGLVAGTGAGFLGLNLLGLLGNGMPWKGLSLSNSSKRASLCSLRTGDWVTLMGGLLLDFTREIKDGRLTLTRPESAT